MTVLIGHPTGNPNSHQAALAHLEAGWLEAFCVPWMPSAAGLAVMRAWPGLRPIADRLSRRRFPALEMAPRVQGRAAEWCRLVSRAIGRGDESISYQANDWIMRTMRQESRRPAVSVVHAYEECAELPFEEAKRFDRVCVYDLPIAYYRAWEEIRPDLAARYADWLPSTGLPAAPAQRLERKRREIELADLVLAPSAFVAATVYEYHPDKDVARTPYGVDTSFWHPPLQRQDSSKLHFLYVGHASVRKGTPLLLEAWRRSALPNAELGLIGSWQLADSKRRSLPKGVWYQPPCSAVELRRRYAAADVLVFPSYFEGSALVVLEAMACGLPVIVSHAAADPQLLSPHNSRVIDPGDLDALVENLRWFHANQGQLVTMRQAARAAAEVCTWQAYRSALKKAIAPFV